MKNKSVIFALILMFGLALGAGVVAGKLSTRIPAGVVPPAARGTLSDALHLTPEQRDKMQAIWENVRYSSRDYMAAAQAVQHEQDDALMKILTEEQRAQYAKMSQESAGKIAVLDGKRKELFKKAVGDTLGILDPSQQAIYQQIIKDKVGELPGGTWEQP